MTEKGSAESRKMVRADIFKELAMEAGKSGDVKVTIENILQKARKLVRCEASSLFLVDKEHGELYTLTLSGQEDGYQVRIPLDKGVAGHCASLGRSLIISDAYRSPHFNPDIDSRTGFKTRNMLCVPIFSNEPGDSTTKRDVIGVVQLLNKLDEKCASFTEDDLADLEELTLLASVFLWSSEVTKFKNWAEAESSQLIRSITRLSSLKGRSSSMSNLHKAVDSPHLLTPSALETLTKMRPELPILEELRSISSFDVLKYHESPARRDILIPLIVTMFTDLGFVEQFGFSSNQLLTLAAAMRQQYRHVPYHNFAHGFDVSHSVYGFLTKGGLADLFEPTECLTLLLAAMFHDADHHGLNNQFHLRSNHPSSILLETTSSDVASVLEIHHCNVAISVLTDRSIELLDALPDEKRTKVWRDMIACILATDMKEHGTFMRDAVQLKEDKSKKLLMMQILLKCADIANLSKPFEQASKWGSLVQEEFYVQGDKERELGLEVHVAFDRYRAEELRNNSLSFLRGVAIPYFKLCAEIFPSLSYVIEGALKNEKIWADKLED
eukprot:TRINITY_DN7896_c0_g2_i1.p1 TRINITY_DN7896_c0_g2~~TRINITY_DN7896_c0_g2_i1.p1  ORF type:complete len:562 (+),score=93.94 TRINITY_DN7896_c0_g2_i1:27-1688(+)